MNKKGRTYDMSCFVKIFNTFKILLKYFRTHRKGGMTFDDKFAQQKRKRLQNYTKNRTRFRYKRGMPSDKPEGWKICVSFKVFAMLFIESQIWWMSKNIYKRSRLVLFEMNTHYQKKIKRTILTTLEILVTSLNSGKHALAPITAGRYSTRRDNVCYFYHSVW